MKTISFTGGYGAQIISAAAYFYLKRHLLIDTGAYLGYFARQPHLATPGVKNDISQWQWELHRFGLNFEDFHQPSPIVEADIIWDGPEKIDLGFAGLQKKDIADLFPVGIEAINYRAEIFGTAPYACLHVRRGDYVNVASYLVSDAAFLRATAKISRLVKNLLVVSDSALSPEMLRGLSEFKLNCITAIGGAPHMIHGLMRLSEILICSNSQFSLTAAGMRDENCLTLYPARHDGDDQSYSNKYLDGIREFQLITRLQK